ncbi:MAG: UvrD-helicase domain-containing protein, partial [Bacteroidaceae bacterium]|nr:UvrD-helicase domain-containing protein [Bacteroidaceae bacterium]
MNTLSKVQREAVEYISGPSLVIAGAGSGKTRVLTHKVAYLMQQGYKPWNILALTFTNKAANEMKERIAKIVGGDSAQYLVMGTFHSIFARILRIEAEHIGYDRNYTIYDEADTKSIVKAATKEVLGAGKSKEELDKLLKNYKPQAIAGTIGLAKNRMITPDIYEKTRGLIERDYEHGMPELHKIYRVYERMLKENNAMDFDDLLLKTYDLLKGNEDTRLKYADQYKFVLVDEYQDTNSVQQRIIELLVKEHHKLCVVGDDAQSIYAFRGAEIDNILDLGKIFPELKLFKLEENYRSTKSIVAVANNLIAHNQRQLHKNVFSNREEGEKPCIMKAVSDRDEAALVANKILNLNRYEHIGFNDIAILYRTNAQSRRFEEQFMKHGCDIPFRIYGGLGFFARAEIKNVISYFRLVVNHNDNEALKRIINYPKRGIGATTIERLGETAAQHGTSIWNIINANDFYGANINSGTKAKIKGFTELISSFSRMLKQMDAFILGEKIISEAGIKQDLKSDQTPEGSARLENLQELLNSLKEFVDMRAEEGEQDAINLDDFLIQAALQTD